MTGIARPEPRPLRRDAARNRKLLLEAGREVFASRGLEASLDEIAHHAGVGVGTAYRHFANKQELAAAIFSDGVAQLIASAHHALDDEDPWRALVGFIQATAATHAGDRGLYEMVTAPEFLGGAPTPSVDGQAATLRDALIEPVTALLERARSAGCVRADASPTDVAAILLMMGEAYAISEAVEREVWPRYLWLLLDGLRAIDRPELPSPALDIDELDTALAAVKKP